MISRAWIVSALTLLASTVVVFLATGTAHAQSLSGEALVKTLQRGGYIIVMRHASSPLEVPDKQTANQDNVKPERQLDAKFPRGTNTIVVTHLPNLTSAFPQQASALADGEAIILGSDGKGGMTLVARVKIGDWPRMRL